MKTLYIECNMGAAGDMLMGALYELLEDKPGFLDTMNGLGLPGMHLEAKQAATCGIAGTHMAVTVHGEEEHEPAAGHGHGHAHGHDHAHPHEHAHAHAHHHATPGHIAEIIDGLTLPDAVKQHARSVYDAIAVAEAKAHGCPVGDVHFHEVGALDAVADVTGVCYLVHLLAPDEVACSPVAVGSGTVRTAHGLLPVPAPATAHLLEGVPVTTGGVEAELCTPTGAALLKTLADSFRPMPAGRVLGCGYGCGTKDFPRANCLRAFLLDTAGSAQGPNDTVTELRANIDDMTGEDLGFAAERLLAAGALDVSYIPLQMKKGRPGVLLLCLCRPEDGDRLAAEILRHTTTFGVRRVDCARYALAVDRNAPPVETEWGPVRRKAGTGYGVEKSKPEYEDLAAAARAGDVPLETARRAFREGK